MGTKNIPNAYKGRYFYHFTHIENIESIVQYGILSTNEKINKGINHVNLANEDIQQRRSEMDVPCEPYGKIHDYVPFYFISINPMLLSVLNRKNIDQPLVVFIAISIDKLLNSDVIFTDASANTSIPPNFFQDPKDLDELSGDLIDSNKWSEPNKDNLHRRMAEVLVYSKVPIEWIESYIVYNDICKNEIERTYIHNGLRTPNISFEPFDYRYFYFTKFFMKGRERETLITGPEFLAEYFRKAIKTIIKKREKADGRKSTFLNVQDALLKINQNFCVIQELEGIFELATDNRVHPQNVSEHTIQVVNNLKVNDYYKTLSEHDKAIVKLSAYLHDIGKGPKSKWKNDIQSAYPDHPADSVSMITRILIEEFNTISEYEIRKICLLVFYHDLLGDILQNGRNKNELLDLEIDGNELNMLIALTTADISAINSDWAYRFRLQLPIFIEEIREEIY